VLEKISQKAWNALSDEEKGMLMLKASLANPGMIRLPAPAGRLI
jgi:hypothetical protein